MRAKISKEIKGFKGWLKDFCIAGIIVVLVTTFGVQNLRVVGNSMAPTLLDGQMVLINKIAYKFSDPQYGDIIGFYAPGIKQKVVKRIIGRPGDTIDNKEGILYINEKPFMPIGNESMRSRGDSEYPYKVPEDNYFVIGDNVNSSIDSRYESIGSIPKEQVIGKISLRVWPFWINPLLR